MSAIKSNYEHKTILDFSKKKISKNYIQKSLRQTDFLQSYYSSDGVEVIFIDNEIRVGMYVINLWLDIVDGAKKLRDYGRFQISIREASSGRGINILKDPLFKSQHWVKLNKNNQLNMSHLVDVILYCNRLDSLRAFL